MLVCRLMHLSVRIHISETTHPIFVKFYLHVAYCNGSIFFPLTSLGYVTYFRGVDGHAVFVVEVLVENVYIKWRRHKYDIHHQNMRVLFV